MWLEEKKVIKLWISLKLGGASSNKICRQVAQEHGYEHTKSQVSILIGCWARSNYTYACWLALSGRVLGWPLTVWCSEQVRRLCDSPCRNTPLNSFDLNENEYQTSRVSQLEILEVSLKNIENWLRYARRSSALPCSRVRESEIRPGLGEHLDSLLKPLI